MSGGRGRGGQRSYWGVEGVWVEESSWDQGGRRVGIGALGLRGVLGSGGWDQRSRGWGRVADGRVGVRGVDDVSNFFDPTPPDPNSPISNFPNPNPLTLTPLTPTPLIPTSLTPPHPPDPKPP